jgi:hypothetical protein
MMSFQDRMLIRLLEDDFVEDLLDQVGLDRLFAISRKLDVGEVKQLAFDGLKRRQIAMPVFETLRETTSDERLLPAAERWRGDREQPRHWRLEWLDAFLEVQIKATIDPRTAPLEQITAADLLTALGGPQNLADLRTALTARYSASVAAAAFEALRITSFEEFRRRGSRLLELRSGPVAPFDPADPANARSYTLLVCLVAADQLLLADVLRGAKLGRSVLEHERQHRELFEDGEVTRPYVFVVLFPVGAAQGDQVPGLSAAEVRERTRALFAAEEMAAHFTAD